MTKSPKPDRPRLLSGGNPQIPKGEGDAPVQAYIAAIEGWQQPLVREIDAIITRTVPGVRKAVKWNSPFYGPPGEAPGWFLNLHLFKRYIKIAFLRGAELDPPPPEPSKSPEVRYLHVGEDDFDAAQFTKWVKQAAKRPPVKM